MFFGIWILGAIFVATVLAAINNEAHIDVEEPVMIVFTALWPVVIPLFIFVALTYFATKKIIRIVQK